MAKQSQKKTAAKKAAKKKAAVLKMDPTAPVLNQIMRPPLRNLVIETDGDTLFMRSCTMGMIELRQALRDTMAWAEAEFNKKAAAPAAPPQPAPEVDAQPAEEATPPQENDDG